MIIIQIIAAMMFMAFVIWIAITISEYSFKGKGKNFINYNRKDVVINHLKYLVRCEGSLDYYTPTKDLEVRLDFEIKNDTHSHMSMGKFIVHAHNYDGNILFSSEPVNIHIDLPHRKKEELSMIFEKDNSFCKNIKNEPRYKSNRLSIQLVELYD